MLRLLYSLPLLAVWTLFQPVQAFEIPTEPEGFVNDYADVLSENEKASLDLSLSAYRRETSNEIAVIIIPSLEGEVIADKAVNIGRQWKIGSDQFNNGVVLLFAIDDREVFIATGYGLEGAIPDIVAKGIIDTDIIPNFSDGNYYEGITKAIDSLKRHIGGEYTAERYEGPNFNIHYNWLFFAIIILLQWLTAILARTRSWWLGGLIGAGIGVFILMIIGWWPAVPVSAVIGFIFDYLVSKNYKKSGKTSWWAGGGWGPGGGSGGGFGGFSGGSFGGGGAGGRW